MKKAFHRPGSIFLAIVLLFTAAPFARSHETFEKVSIQLQWRHQFEFAGFYAAKEKGYYRDVGLDVEIREYKSGADIMESVLSGEATFGLLHGEVIRARMRGKPVILLANYFKRSPMALAVKPDIFFPDELKGRIVMGEKHEIESSNFVQMFQRFNMTTDDFTVVPHTFTADKFISGEVDAMTVFLTNEVYQLGQKKASFNIIDPNNYGVSLYDVNLFTAEARADKKPEVVRAFTDASNKGWAYALEHPAEIIDLILEEYNSQGKSKPHLLFEARETRRIMRPDIYPIGSIDPNRIRKMEELFVLEGVADAIVEPESFIFGMDGHDKSLFTPGEKAFIKNHPTVRVVRSFHQPPFAVHQEGRLTGYLYDLLSEVLSLAGLKAEYVGGFTTYDAMVEAVGEGAVDVLPNMNSTRALPEKIIRTVPVVTTPNALVAKISAPGITRTSDLFGKRVAAVKGYAQDEHLDKFPRIRKVLVENNTDGFEAVRTGKAEYFFNNLANAGYVLRKTFATDLRIAGALSYADFPPLTLSFAVNADHPELVGIINKTLAAAPLDALSRTRDKWLVKAYTAIPAVKVDLTPEEQAFLEEHPVIRVSNEMNWPPFDFAENGVPRGYSIDLFNLIAEKAGLRIEYINGLTWDELLMMGKRRELDLFPAIWKTDERERFLDFSTPYIDTPYILVIHEDEHRIQTIDDLKGRVLTGVKGYASTETVKKHYPGIRIIEAETPGEGLRLVSYGKADAYLGSYGETNFEIRSHLIPNLVVAGETTLGGRALAPRLHIAVRKDWPTLDGIVQKALDAVTQEEKRDLQAKWLTLKTEAKRRAFEITEEERAFLKDHPILRAAFDPDWPPVEFLGEDGGMKGISADYLERMGKILGVRFEAAAPRPWKELMDAVKSGELDFFSAISPTDQRREWMDFTDAHLSFPIVIVTREDVPYIGSLDELAGKTAAVVDGRAPHDLLAANHPELTLAPTRGVKEGLKAVASGKAFAYIDSLAAVSHVIRREGLKGLKVSGDTAYAHDIAMGVRGGEAMLSSLLQKALAAIPDHEKDAIYAKWIGVTFQPKVDYSLVWKTIAAALVIVFLILYWNRRLRYMARELKKSEENYRSIFEAANDAILIHDIKTGAILNVNEKMLDIFGFAGKEEVVGSFVDRLSSGEKSYTVEKAEEWMEKAVKGEPQLFEWRARDKNGRLFWTEVNLKRVVIGGEDKIIAIVRDISFRKRAEEELLREKAFSDAAIASLPGIFYVFDESGKFLRWNRNFETVSGRSGSAISRMRPEKFFPPDQRARLKETIREVFDKGWSSLEADFLSKDGSTTAYLLTGARFEVRGSFCLAGMGVDITHRKQAERERLKLKKLESVGVLAGGIAHDFNNLLTGVFGNIEMAKMHLSADHKSCEFLEFAGQSMESATNLSEQLLTFAKGGDPIKETLSIGEVITETANFSTRGSNIKPRFDIDPDLWRVEADKGQLSQVIGNLVINAQQATPDGGVVAIAARNVENGEGRRVKITVRDEGVGIASQHLDKIFDPYFSTRREGSGLGLASTHSIISKHNGAITVDSELNKGATFTIHLPAAGKTEEKAPGKSSEEVDDVDVSGARILVMDDKKSIRRLLGVMLGRMGCNVSFAADGREAITEYREASRAGAAYDIVVVDLTVPGGMGGREAAREILKMNPAAKIIVSSGYATDPVMANYEKYGFKGVVPKPYQYEKLKKEIQRLFVL